MENGLFFIKSKTKISGAVITFPLLIKILITSNDWIQPTILGMGPITGGTDLVIFFSLFKTSGFRSFQ